jgi:polysaccharide deacetylase family protein (PEP-CTERM system associated)
MNVTNALSVDVEDYFHVAAFAPNIHRDSWTSRESRVVGNTQRLLIIFEQFDVRATFFVLGWVAERHPQLVRDIAARGHEIACHGFSHRLVYEQSPEEFYEETLRSKNLLEDITGSAVLGYRAASYSIVRESLWALDILVELGFVYDSSIFPVHHDRYGIPDAERAPHRMSTPNGKFIVEWPLATATILGFRLPVAGGGYFRLLPYWLSRWGLASINRRELRPFIFRGSHASRRAACRGFATIRTLESARRGCGACLTNSGSIRRGMVLSKWGCFPGQTLRRLPPRAARPVRQWVRDPHEFQCVWRFWRLGH